MPLMGLSMLVMGKTVAEMAAGQATEAKIMYAAVH